MKTMAKRETCRAKALLKRIMLFLWLFTAATQLLFTASVAPAKSFPGLENRAWKILTLAAQRKALHGSR